MHREGARIPVKRAFTRRTLLDGAAALVVALGSGGCAQVQSRQGQVTSKLAIIHTNDTHGHDLLDDESLGLAAVRQLQKNRGFSLDDTYTVASIDFLCMGGDSYYVFSEAAGTTMKSLNALLSDSVIFYLTERCNGEVSEEYRDQAGQGRITVIV